MTQIPAWLPDWLDEFRYPNHEYTQAWAWEFLRRNSDYQRDWEFAQRHWDKWAFDDDIYDIIEDGDWALNNKVSRPIYDQLARKWGLSIIIMDPALDWDQTVMPPCFETTPNTFMLDVREINGRVIRAEGGPQELWECGVIFDLRLPINSQIDYAKRALKRKQKRLTEGGKIHPLSAKNEVALFPSYLRCFDARQRNVPFSEISNHLLDRDERPTYETAKNYYKAAKRLVDGGYRAIPIYGQRCK